MVRAVWLGSGWFRLCGQGSTELLGRGLVSFLGGSAVWPGSSQLLGWFRLRGQGLVSCLVSILHVLYRMEMK